MNALSPSRSLFFAMPLGLATLLLGGMLLPAPVRAGEPTFRDLVRKFVDAQQADQPTDPLPGLPDDVQRIVALEYTVLLREGGEEKAVDAQTYQFQLGDQIRVRIEPLSDLYIYIFHEGASGEQVCLLPQDKETPPLAKQGEPLVLPSDGSVFEFAAPPGDEMLIVVATEQPSDDLAVLADVVFKKDSDQLTPEEKAIHDKLKARSRKTLMSIRQRQARSTRYRGLFDDQELEKVGHEVSQQGTSRAVLEEPPHGEQTSTFSMAASFKKDDAGELFVTIPLKSVSPDKAN